MVFDLFYFVTNETSNWLKFYSMLKKIEMRKSLAIIALSALSITACQKETPYDPSLDNELTSILQSQSPTGSIDYFKLPSSTDYASALEWTVWWYGFEYWY